jgi:hypothetical protein
MKTTSALGRGLAVALSVTVYVACLTQTAFVSPGAYFDHGIEIPIDAMENSAIYQLLYGWIAVPFALLMFYLNPLAAVPVAAAALFAWMRLRGFAAVAAFIAVALMWKGQILGFASWLANPLLAAAWIFCLRNRLCPATVFSAIALVLMISFLAIDEVPFGLKSAGVPIARYGIGYWLWIASAALMLAVAGDGFLMRAGQKEPIKPNQSN